MFELQVRSVKSCERPSLYDTLHTVVCQLDNVPLTPPLTSRRQPRQVVANASHVCRPPSTIEFHYSQQYFIPFDIYAMEGRKMCSKCSGSGQGRGSYDNPYILRVDVNDPTHWHGCQGTVLGNNVYNLKILVQQAEFIIQNSDILYNIVCDFNQNNIRPTSASSGLMVGGEPPMNNATEESTKITLSVVAPNGSTPVDMVSIGDKIRLRMSLQQTSGAPLVRGLSHLSKGATQMEVRRSLVSLRPSNSLLIPPYSSAVPSSSATPLRILVVLG
ncbi:Hypothetical predicted protein [Argonauta hians]